MLHDTSFAEKCIFCVAGVCFPFDGRLRDFPQEVSGKIKIPSIYAFD